MASGSASASYDPATKNILKAGLGTIATHSLSSVLAMARGTSPTKREVIQLIGENVTPATDFVSKASGGTFLGDIFSTNLSGTNTGDQTLPTDFVSAANGGAFLGNITVPATSQPLLPNLISDTTSSIANLEGSYTETIMIADVFNVVGSVVLSADFYMSKISDDGTNVTLTGSGSITGSGTMGQSFPFFTGTPAGLRTQLGLGTVATHSLSSVLAMASGSASKPVTDFVSAASGGTFLGNVTIPGGTIDNTPIGATTANTGSFTTLVASGTVSALGGGSGNWNTAYGWGNHASAGYVTSGSPWTTTGSDIYYNTGNVGINNSGPSEKLYVGGNISATGDITSSASDERLKENIEPINNAVEKIKQIKGITFDWINNIEEIVGSPWNDTTERHVGVLAQDVQKILPEVVRHAPFDLDEHKKSKSGHHYLTVKYEHLVPLLIEAIKEQQVQIDELKEKRNGI
jgi:hypothetical protein